MVLSQTQLVNHNLNFFNDVVDAKVDAWKRVSGAYDRYTHSFFSEQLRNGDKAIEAFGKSMKESAKMCCEGYRD